jgi:hypothetical protein
MRTDLSSGAWIEHRPIQDLKAKDKDAIGRVISAHLPSTGDEEMPALAGATRALIMTVWRDATWARVLTAWSLDLELPQITGERGAEQIAGRDSIGELGLDDFDDIAQVLQPYVARIMRVPSPKGTTSSSSNGSPRAKARSSPTG